MACKSSSIMKVKGVNLYRGGGHSGCPSRKRLTNGNGANAPQKTSHFQHRYGQGGTGGQ